MPPLARVFVAKIAATVLLWAGPLLLAPPGLLAAAGLPRAAVPVARLLGWAYLALCVGYGAGFLEARAGRPARAAAVVGLVSNAGAGACLAYTTATGGWAGWHPAAPPVAWACVGLTLSIAGALYWFGLRGGAGAGFRRAISTA